MTTTPRAFRDQRGTLGLERTECTECGKINERTAETCYNCGARDLSVVEMTPRGEVVTFIVQHHLPDVFDTPLPIAIVETPEGGKILGMYTDVEDFHDIDIGDKVEIELRRFTRDNGEPIYVNKFTQTAGEDQ